MTEVLLERLGAKRFGSGWMIPCPAHDDGTPSCSIAMRNGKLLVYCHAGCSQKDVINKLRDRGLWPSEERNQERRITATYRYTDQNGKLLYEVVRFEPGRAGKKKDFAHRSLDSWGNWQWKKAEQQVLYQLPSVLAAPIVFIVEGEKDVDALRERGFVATCNAGGAGTWRDEYNPIFYHNSVVIIPDRDVPGWAHARQVMLGVKPHAASVVVVDLENAKDVSEWFERGHSETELVQLLEPDRIGNR